MKSFLFFILLFISGAQSSYSIGLTNAAEKFIDFFEADNKEYIRYEFGFSKTNTVYIINNDTHFDVYISNGDNIEFSTTCNLSPILNWAFEKAPNELASAQFVTNKEYNPLYYQLTIMVNGAPSIIDSSSMRITGRECVVEKIDELKSFIISLWMDSLDAQNED